MSDQWYYRMFDEQFGPVALEELVEFVQRQQLAADDEVKLGESGKWRKVGSIGRLVAAIPYEAVEKTIVPTATMSHRFAIEQPVADEFEDLSELALQMDTDVQPAGISRSANTVAGRVHGAQPAGRIRNLMANNFSDPSMPDTVRPTPMPPAEHRPGRPSRPVKQPDVRPGRPAGPSWLSRLAVQLKAPKAMGLCCVIALVTVLFGWGMLPRSKAADIRRYHQLKVMLEEIRKTHDNPSELVALNSKATKLSKDLTGALLKDLAPHEGGLFPASRPPAKQCLLWAARDELPRVFNRPTPELKQNAEKSLAAHLQQAAVELGLQERPVFTPAQGAPLPED